MAAYVNANVQLRLCLNVLVRYSLLLSSEIRLRLTEYLSNRPQVSMVYRLINHAGCQNTRTIFKSRAAGEGFTNSSSVMPTFQVVYQPINHRNLWSIAFI